MNRFPRLLLNQKPHIFISRATYSSSSSSNNNNTIIDSVKKGAKRAMDAVNDIAKNLDQTPAKASALGNKDGIKNPIGEKMKHDDKAAPHEAHEELKHEKARKTGEDIKDAGKLIKESKPI